MSQELSIGNELKDSFKTTSKWVNNGIGWLSDLEEFYRERAVIEKEYSTKLKELCKKHFDKKAKASASVSVGDEPQITPGSLEAASVVMWTEVLTQTEAIAEEKASFHKEINTKIADNLVTLKSKCTNISKQIDRIDEILVHEKQASEDEVNKSKKAYDSLCQTTESAREKAEKSSSDRAQHKLEDKTIDMNNGKNDYLIKINVANRLKDKYYYQDVPELLDYLQELNENRIGLLNKILKNASIIERNSMDKVKEKLLLIDSTIDQNNPKLDTAMFIKHNQIEWQEPADFYFVPSSIWHDDESLITKEPELTTLKKRLNQSSREYQKLSDICLDSKQKLEESTLSRKSDPAELTLKFDAPIQVSLSILQTFMKNDSLRVKSEVEIEVIQNYAGDKDLSYQEHVQHKKSTFGFLRHKSTKKTDANNDDNQSIHTVKSNTTTISSGVFNLRKKAQSIKSLGSQSAHSGGDTCRALYAYEASGDDEVSINPGDDLSLVSEDDGSGWTKVQTPDGSQGLVPTTYIEIVRSEGKKKGPSVAPKRGAKRVQYVEALYDYHADGDDEISISAGDRIVLTQPDTDGSGWTEGQLNGNTGMFPTSYVRAV